MPRRAPRLAPARRAGLALMAPPSETNAALRAAAKLLTRLLIKDRALPRVRRRTVRRLLGERQRQHRLGAAHRQAHLARLDRVRHLVPAVDDPRLEALGDRVAADVVLVVLR